MVYRVQSNVLPPGISYAHPAPSSVRFGQTNPSQNQKPDNVSSRAVDKAELNTANRSAFFQKLPQPLQQLVIQTATHSGVPVIGIPEFINQAVDLALDYNVRAQQAVKTSNSQSIEDRTTFHTQDLGQFAQHVLLPFYPFPVAGMPKKLSGINQQQVNTAKLVYLQRKHNTLTQLKQALSQNQNTPETATLSTTKNQPPPSSAGAVSPSAPLSQPAQQPSQPPPAANFVQKIVQDVWRLLTLPIRLAVNLLKSLVRLTGLQKSIPQQSANLHQSASTPPQSTAVSPDLPSAQPSSSTPTIKLDKPLTRLLQKFVAVNDVTPFETLQADNVDQKTGQLHPYNKASWVLNTLLDKPDQVSAPEKASAGLQAVSNVLKRAKTQFVTTSVHHDISMMLKHLSRNNMTLDPSGKNGNAAPHPLKVQQDFFSLQAQHLAREKDAHESGQVELKTLNDKFQEILAQKQAGESFITDKDLEKLQRSLKRLDNISPLNPERDMILRRMETILDLPWSYPPLRQVDPRAVEKTINDEFYGMENIAKLVADVATAEFHRTQQGVREGKGRILCFVGPPGVGKTAVGRAIAKATGRKFADVSLGGLQDPHELRGHRSTYIGSMEGKIMEAVKEAGTNNLVLQLDELDKMGDSGWRGNPYHALLRALDPAVNHSFRDDYLDINYNLSPIMFITTANDVAKLRDNYPALYDRMEVVEMPGYIEAEKRLIIDKHLIPEARQTNGLKESEFDLTDDAKNMLIKEYASGSGVRGEERHLTKLARRQARQITQAKLENKPYTLQAFTRENILETLDPPRPNEIVENKKFNQLGIANALSGSGRGDIFQTQMMLEREPISTLEPTQLEIAAQTGLLTEMTDKSLRRAFHYVKGNVFHPDESHRKAFRDGWGINIFDDDSDDKATYKVVFGPKRGESTVDGPSAGGLLSTQVMSLLTRRPVRADIGMTGTISFTGKLDVIGGLKEKLAACHRDGLFEVIVPLNNLRDIDKFPALFRQFLRIEPAPGLDPKLLETELQKTTHTRELLNRGPDEKAPDGGPILTIRPVDRVEQAWEIALEKEPLPELGELYKRPTQKAASAKA
ncbi:MAG: AAA family ATPase [Vampirovibrio sp.]|nr:AAA family ATPase [Vampirovibrio sp.]